MAQQRHRFSQLLATLSATALAALAGGTLEAQTLRTLPLTSALTQPEPSAQFAAQPPAKQIVQPPAKQVPETVPPAPVPETPTPAPFGQEAGGATGGEFASLAASNMIGPGYIDYARPFSHFRLRYDTAYRNNRPDRAEYFYAKCGCFRTLPVGADPDAAGPPLPETSVDYQDVNAYLELAPTDRLSGFIEVPYRFLNPDQNANTNGFADMFAGFKYAFVSTDSEWLTFQFRTAIPTGRASAGLGTHHVSLEPGILYYKQVDDRLSWFGEIKDWIPVGGTDFAGNVLEYGVGVGYSVLGANNLVGSPSGAGAGGLSITPMLEFVGWTVLSGREFGDGLILDASGNTILNGKVGARIGWDDQNSLYVGYGRALTGAVWYKDILRVEYRFAF